MKLLENNSLVEQLNTEFGDAVQFNAPLGALTTYRVGGNASFLLTISDESQLHTADKIVREFEIPVLVIGKGSNQLIADTGFDGLVISLGSAFNEIEHVDSQITAGSAMALPILARKCVGLNVGGLEWLVGIPGSVGGAIRMNAGGHGSSVIDVLINCELISIGEGRTGTFPPQDLDLKYRHSNIAANEVVTRVTFKCEENVTGGEARIEEIVAWRRENQPGGQNAGSVFSNPENDSAGRLIDEAGLSGKRIGTAEVSSKHCNFIQADSDGSADDVFKLMRLVRNEVWQRSGVELKNEVRLVGFGEEL